MCLAETSSTTIYARVAQLVEHDLAKVGAAGSSPVSRSLLCKGHPMDVFFLNAASTQRFEIYAPVVANQRPPDAGFFVSLRSAQI